MRSLSRVSRIPCPSPLRHHAAICCLALTPLMAILGRSAHAQRPADGAGSCVDALVPVDSVQNFVSAVVETTDADGTRAVRVPSYYLNVVVDEIASRITVPAGIAGGAFVPLPYPVVLSYGDTMYLAAPAVRASLIFTLNSEGRVTGVSLWGSSLNDVLEEAAWRAIVATDSAGTIPPFPRELRRDDLLLRLIVEPEQFWTQAPPRSFTTRSDLRPVLRLSRHVVRVNSLPSRVLAEGTGMGLSRGDTLRFVISEEGEVVPGTLSVSSVNYLQAAAPVLEQIAQLRFSPVRSGACAVPMLMEIPLM